MTLTSQNIDRHQKKQKFQQLLRSGPIVPGNFSFFLIFFGAFAGLMHLVVCFFWFFGACAGLVHLLVCLFF